MAAELTNGFAQTISVPNPAPKSKSSRRRRKQKKSTADTATAREEGGSVNGEESAKENSEVAVEYVPEKVYLEDHDEEFGKIFKKFNSSEAAGSEENDDMNDISDFDDEREKLGGIYHKKKKPRRPRMKTAELKQISSRPDVVEAWDATSADPKLLVYLKSYQNTVPVPKHWCQKRKYMQGKSKRGVGKQPYQLPDYIVDTGIEKARRDYKEEEELKPTKQIKKLDIEYQVLHDACFKYQTKPELSSLGDLYHEGKEFEEKRREMKPGTLSQELKEALGMPEGAPPPWLINMQRYGPPPSYECGLPVHGKDYGQQQELPNHPKYWEAYWGELEEEEEEEEKEAAKVEEPAEEEEEEVEEPEEEGEEEEELEGGYQYY